MGIVADPVPWFGCGDARNPTPRTFDESLARAADATARTFLPYAQALLESLEKQND